MYRTGTVLAAVAALVIVSTTASVAQADPLHTTGLDAVTEQTITLDTRSVTAAEPADDADSGDEVTAQGRYGSTFPRDSDGHVPEYFGSYTGCSDGVIGRATYTRSGGVTKWTIRYDTCEMRRLGAGDNDWTRLKAHERAHTRGWGHWEAPQSDNPAYYPKVRICGC
ncbi:hypothetical protein [Saccharothrix hoggarensis]|uniref:Secreted protein n=1 Tax=Saccharothrix hoggarensis TaxID=913853 RepID=A0ABW3QMZ7_9PSEU